MARIVTPLVDTKIKNAKAKEKNYTLSDGQGLQLLIKTDGKKLWEFYYTSPITLKRRKTSLGLYPTVKLGDKSKDDYEGSARWWRDEYLKLLSKNIDPIQHFKEEKEKKRQEGEKEKHSIKFIIDKYFDYRKNMGMAERTFTKEKARVENNFSKKIGEKTNIHTLTFEQTLKALTSLEKDEKYETLDKVKGHLIRIFKFAYGQNILKDTELFAKLELYKFKKQTVAKNNPTLTKKEDIKKLYSDILLYKYNLITRYLLITTIHTAQRQGSIITAQWRDIDFDNKLWIIPKEHMKGTAKAKKDHHLPLSDILVKYLKELYQITGDNEYLFPNSQINKTRNKYPHISNNTVTSALRRMGYTKEQQTAHGFRAMFKTVCKEHQESDNLKNEFVERVLAHKVEGDVEGAYNRADNIKDMRIVINWWSKYLEDLKND
ncbi:MAG: tyrosine-type recombinase/integrase [Sphaerochaetaceae bacterium]|nr:tyrosine-type recombinase/integrase [Sphaerochaetaceae bacterium]